ncbi:MAG TPA: nucleotide disphospho-sugar-binding domain-containing protein [Pyrinomonadaceae bacterium]|nr:nucleotide disphospho-sugar-binding domain-containing protein [Pyrinomonadaceae bacterium]
MTSGKRIILSTFGSFGDIHPYVAIALALKARGHSPVIATSEVYREKMESAAIEFFPVRPDMPSYDEPDEITRIAEELIDPKTGSEKVLELFTQNLRDIYDDLNAAVEGADLLVTHPLTLVGPSVAQKRNLRWVSSVLAPISFFSNYDPPVLPQLQASYHVLKLSPHISRLAFGVASFKLNKLMAPVYKLRAELGLPRGGQPLMAGQHSPQMVLALFSSVLGKPQPDWPRNTKQTGFLFYDRRDYFGSTGTDPVLAKFLDDGPPPIVFTLGSSAFWVAKDFYRDSISAAVALGQRALLLVGHQRNVPEGPLPEGVAALEYAPFGEVFPRARAIVHQGGVGTIGQAMRSGRPVLVLPHAHDQFDNAMRVVRSGCGRSLPRPRYNAATATTELKALLGNPEYFANAEKIGAQVQSENGAARAADAIEEVLIA